MFDLIGNVLLTATAVTHSHSVTLQVTWWLNIWVLWIFFSAESLENKVEEYSHGEVGEFGH
jgi:hypothetical protein